MRIERRTFNKLAVAGAATGFAGVRATPRPSRSPSASAWR